MQSMIASEGRGARELRELDQVLSALAHASRRHVLVVLLARGGRMSAGQIARRFACAWPTTSRHLRILQAAGLVRVERQGREWIYVLEREHLLGVLRRWLQHFGAVADERKER
jgi:DNA-binding transcriptional ArsR family regulator